MSTNEPNDDRTQSFIALTKGTEVGHYRIIEKIGAGGMGEVYLAEDSTLKRKVALKFMPFQYMNDANMRERFTREARAVAALSHPNIVTIFEVGEYNKRPFFAMEHVKGETLKGVIKKGKLTTNEAIDYAMQICEGLHKAHDSGIVHRDIKPANIILDSDNRARILDFGLAMVAGEEKLTKTGSTLGTVGYMSPEQIEGVKVDHRSDLFSVGVILYEMVTGRRPFEGDNDAAVFKAIASSSPEPIARFKSGVTGQLQAVIDKALSKDISIRYQHADGMYAELKRLQTETSVRKKGRLGLWAAAAVIVIAGGYFSYAQFFREKPKPTGPKRLVVLPFDNLGGEDQDYFASGVTDEVISRLSSISGLSVVSRMSAARMKEAGEDIKAIGKELGVEYVLDASARYQLGSDGSRHVRLTTQLINVTEDKIIWSKTYDTVMTEFFAVQANIAEQVAEQMNVVLLDAEKKEVWERWTDSEEAWDYYRRGGKEAYRYGGYGEKPLRTGLALYNKALDLDSNFALPYVALADIYGRLYSFGFDRSDSIKALSLRSAQKAAELSDHVWVSNFPFGRYHAQVTREWEKALDYYEKAYRGDKNHAEYLNYAHHILRRMGRWEEAYDYMKRVVELEPKGEWHIYDLACDCFYMHRYAEAESLFIETITLSPTYWEAYSQLFVLYAKWHGDLEKAKALVKQSEGFIEPERWDLLMGWIGPADGKPVDKFKGISMPPMDSLNYHYSLGLVYSSLKKTDSARLHFEYMSNFYNRREDDLDKNPGLNKSFAQMFAGLGDREQAIAHMDKAMAMTPYNQDALRHANLLSGYLDMFQILGDTESQIKTLDSVLSIPSRFGLGWMIIDPDYIETVLHPDFMMVMEKHADSVHWRLYNEKVGSL